MRAGSHDFLFFGLLPCFLKAHHWGNYAIKQLRAWYLLLQSGLAVLYGLPPSLSSRKFFWLSVGSPISCVPLGFSGE